MRRFVNRVCVVTGAAHGIGLAAATRLGSEGACVVVADIDSAGGLRAAEEVLSAGAAAACARICDVSDEADVVATLEATVGRFGRLDVVVNNAGIMLFSRLVELSSADWHRVLAVNLDGPFYFIKHALGRMQAGGSIVNVSSVHAERTQPLAGAYAASKAGLLSLTRSAAIEGEPRGIRVNAVIPGAVDTAMLRTNPNVISGAEVVDEAALCRPEDVAAAIAWLASSDARSVQGAALRVDGGRGVQL